MLFNEPKLLKSKQQRRQRPSADGFSALQRAEIAEIVVCGVMGFRVRGVSVLFNEPKLLKLQQAGIIPPRTVARFSALQRAEIAEMKEAIGRQYQLTRFSALQRAEIAEIAGENGGRGYSDRFQCSSTSRNC